MEKIYIFDLQIDIKLACKDPALKMEIDTRNINSATVDCSSF